MIIERCPPHYSVAVSLQNRLDTFLRSYQCLAQWGGTVKFRGTGGEHFVRSSKSDPWLEDAFVTTIKSEWSDRADAWLFVADIVTPFQVDPYLKNLFPFSLLYSASRVVFESGSKKYTKLYIKVKLA